MKKIILTRGIPASGKSTWSKQEVLKDIEHSVRINRDDLRNMSGQYWVPARENYIISCRNQLLNIAIYMGCLLYTSPSPRDLSTSRMPSSA